MLGEEKSLINNKSICVIGLDGGTFNVVKPLVEEGKLPNLARLMKEGSWGNLISTIPSYTSCAWPSFLTGKNPGKHGVFYFLSPKKDSYKGEIVSAKSIRTTTLLKILSIKGKRIGVVDIPLTFPPEEVNGFLVSGMPIPSHESIFTYPPELHTELIRECGEFLMEDDVIKPFYAGNLIETIKMLYKYAENRKKVALYLLSKYKYDFFMIVFRGVDIIQHYGLRYENKTYCKKHPDEAKKYGYLVTQYYEVIDAACGEILQTIDKNCQVIIMSDHGITPLRKHFFVNKWLINEGLLKLRKYYKYHLSTSKHTIADVLKKINLNNLLGLIPKNLSNYKITICRLRKTTHLSNCVNWKKTKAYATWTGGEELIRINLKGREPQGIVDEEEYETLRDDIIRRLYTIYDNESGKQVIENVHKREEFYHGPYVKSAPDLIYVTDNMSYYPLGDIEIKDVIGIREDKFFAPHHQKGMIIMCGTNIKKGMQFTGEANIVDLAPTILYLLGLPVPEDMDGQILLEMIENSYRESNPVNYEIVKPQEVSIIPEELYSVEEKYRIEEHLKGLGYIS